MGDGAQPRKGGHKVLELHLPRSCHPVPIKNRAAFEFPPGHRNCPAGKFKTKPVFFFNFFIFLLRFFADPFSFFLSPPPSHQRGAAGHGTHIADLQRALESRPGISAQSPGGGIFAGLFISIFLMNQKKPFPPLKKISFAQSRALAETSPPFQENSLIYQYFSQKKSNLFPLLGKIPPRPLCR